LGLVILERLGGVKLAASLQVCSCCSCDLAIDRTLSLGRKPITHSQSMVELGHSGIRGSALSKPENTPKYQNSATPVKVANAIDIFSTTYDVATSRLELRLARSQCRERFHFQKA
jgi:hypothetical protein